MSGASASSGRTSGMPWTGMRVSGCTRDGSRDGGERVAASAAATRASVISVSATTARTPSASISPARAASPASITSVLQNVAVLAGDADARHVDARAGPSAGRPGPSPDGRR